MQWGKLRKTGVSLIRLNLLVLTAILCLAASVSADTIVQGFNSKAPIEPGMIVALDKNSKNTITPVPASHDELIYGVVIDPSQAPLTVRQEGQQYFVATGGNYSVFVSNENGPVQIGDYISTSSI